MRRGRACRLRPLLRLQAGWTNVSGGWQNSLMQKWFKYTYVCTGVCNALIEYTMKAGYTPNVAELTCLCGEKTIQVSVEDATISPTLEKEEKMETTAPIMYDANVLVTYKSINNGEVSYPTIKVNQLEYELESKKVLGQRLNELQSKVNKIIDSLTREYWYNPNTDKEEILNELCEILDYEPKQEVQFEGVIRFSGRVDVPLDEDYDLESILSDISVDIYNGDVIIDDYSLDSVEEQY